MRFRYVTLIACLASMFAGTAAANAQRLLNDPSNAPRLDVAAGYSYIRANAPPGGCPCFGLNGGFASAAFHLTNWFAVAGEFDTGHANDISTLGQNLTLTTFMGGPRISLVGRRITPFAQGLVGGARASGSYFPGAGGSSSTGQSSFAVALGGGIDYNLTWRIAIRPVQAQYLHTSFSNGTTNEQNQLMIGAGIVMKFGHIRMPVAAKVVPPPPPPPSRLALSCDVNMATVEQGQMIDIVASPETNGNPSDVRYSWSASGGRLEGAGNHVVINTRGVTPGEYMVSGHAFFASGTGNMAECNSTFRVLAIPPAPTPPAPAVITVEAKQRDLDFHRNVKDVFFDYDKSQIRPDGQQAIQNAAVYLKAHTDLQVLLGGYSDERGTTEYNLSLGAKRANAVRDALIAAGIDGSKLTVISYGKGAQVCTEGNEACWQQNRRTAFMLQP